MTYPSPARILAPIMVIMGKWLLFLAPLFALVLGPACTKPEQALEEKTSGESVTVEVNSKAPAFAAQTLDGRPIRLADYVGSHVVLLEFWSIFCKSCVEEMPFVEELHRRYSAQGLAVLSVNTDVFSANRVRSFLQKMGIRPPYPVVRDARQEVVEAYKVQLLPVTVIIDRSGWIRLYQEGYCPGDEKRFETQIQKLLGRREAEDVTLASRGGVTVFAPTRAAPAEPGKVFAKLRGLTVQGREVAIDGAKGNLIFFWSLFCKPCREEFPAMVRIAQEGSGKGLGVYGVNVDSARLAQRVTSFAAGYPAIPCLADGSEGEGKGELARTLGVRATPTHILLDGKGKVVFTAAGATDLPALQKHVRGLVGGE